ncbi:MAG: NfeD family protein [Oleiphilaceae bacterium]|nr:NfeD family protein [Oleiphilaceae bacterium]
MEISPVLFFCLAGLVLIGIELVVFQLSVVWLLFIGSGALLASGLGWLLDWNDWTTLTAAFVIASVVITALLYRPLKRWQDKPGPIAGNDAIGQQVRLKTEITPGGEGKVMWSGSEWTAVLNSNAPRALAAGESGYIEAVSGIKLFITHTPEKAV